MGGNALKHLGVTRLNKHLYELLTNDIRARVTRVLGQTPVLIKSYSSKPNFGDADFLVESDYLHSNWHEHLTKEFDSKGAISNGGVISMEISDFQVDFITTSTKDMQWAQTYYAFNDLGNLMGRIAHKMGFSYGHEGLVKIVRTEDHVIGRVKIKATPSEVFSFMDYSYPRWQKGFETLEDIFEYAASTIYFDPKIYLLDNRNHVSRTRDAKRETYTKFLAWCDGKSGTFNWDAKAKTDFHDFFLKKAFDRFAGFEEEYKIVWEEHEKDSILRAFFNGDMAMEWIPEAKGKELGELIARVKNSLKFDILFLKTKSKMYDDAATSLELRDLTVNTWHELRTGK